MIRAVSKQDEPTSWLERVVDPSAVAGEGVGGFSHEDREASFSSRALELSRVERGAAGVDWRRRRAKLKLKSAQKHFHFQLRRSKLRRLRV